MNGYKLLERNQGAGESKTETSNPIWGDSGGQSWEKLSQLGWEVKEVSFSICFPLQLQRMTETPSSPPSAPPLPACPGLPHSPLLVLFISFASVTSAKTSPPHASTSPTSSLHFHLLDVSPRCPPRTSETCSSPSRPSSC